MGLDPVDLLDVAPSLLIQTGATPPESMQGRDLSGNEPLPERDLVADLHADPPFETNVAPRDHTLAGLLSTRTESATESGPPLDAETLEGLRTLGYAD